MRKELELAKPIISTYMGYALSLSIILNKQNGIDWFVQNYNNIITVYTEDYEELFMDFINISNIYVNSQQIYQPDNFLCQPLKTYSIPRNYVQENELIQFIQKQINNNFYLCLFINRGYINQHNSNMLHDIFVYGYDDEKEVIYICDYFNENRFSPSTCTYSEFINAYKNAGDFLEDNNIFNDNTDVSKINLLSFNDFYNNTFNIHFFIDSLNYYLNPEMYSMNYKIQIFKIKNEIKSKRCFGIDNIKIISKYITSKIENNESIDIRQLHLFYDHKHAYRYKIEYFLKKGYKIENNLIVLADMLEKLALNIRNLSIKYDTERSIQSVHINKKSYIERINHYLHDIYEMETTMLKQLIMCLDA
jgi:hypothetical protein